MRSYSKVTAKFWTGATGKQLRGNPEAQLVALYLMTCANSEMTGVFHCPILYVAHETGIGIEGASKGLQRLIEAGFCSYDDDSEAVFVHSMARYQIADELKPSDNQVKSVQKAFTAIGAGPFGRAFFDRYKTAFHLERSGASDAPSKPLASQEQEQEQEQFSEHLQENKTGAEHSDDASLTPLPTVPSLANKKPRKAEGEVNLQTFIDECKAAGIKNIPEGDPVFDYAEKIGLPDEFLALHWQEFKARYTLPDAKKYKDWRAVFRKSVKGNWQKIWYATADGKYTLTTTGLQARTYQKNSTAYAGSSATH